MADTQQDFNFKKQQAADALREMSRRASRRETETPPQNRFASQHTSSGSMSGLLPFNINSLKLDDDTILILGILLILSSEKADNLLLLALVYILM